MAIDWGSRDNSGGNSFRVGIDLSVSGTTITAKYYVESQYSASDNQTLTRTSNLTGSTSYTKSGSGVQLVYTGTKTGSRGTKYTFGAKLSGLYTGGTPSVSTSITIPAAVPSKPQRPSLTPMSTTSVKGVLSSAPANNGAKITDYGWELDSGGKDGTTDSRSWTATGVSANTTYKVRVRAKNSAGWGSWSDWSSAATTPPAAPSAPDAPNVARNSDTSHTVSWSRNATSAAPYASQRIQRRQYVTGSWGSWSQIASISGSVSSYTDTTTRTASVYQYRIVAVNAVGTATSDSSATFRTTPPAPTGLVAESDGATSIAVTGTDIPTNPTVATYSWQGNPGGAGWVNISGTTAGTASRTFTGVNPAVTNQYRAATTWDSNTTNTGNLTSAWSAPSNVVQLQAPPNSPTVKVPAAVMDRDSEVVVSFKHNPVDTTKQTAFNLHYRLNGGAWTVVSGTTATTATIPAQGVSGLLEVQAQTKGAHASFSAWSASTSVTLAAVPSVVINTPGDGEELPGSITTVEWEFYAPDAGVQAAWELIVTDTFNGLRISAAGGTGTTETATFGGLTNQTWAEFALQVRSSTGLWSPPSTILVFVDFAPPQPATTSVEWVRDDGSASLSFELDASDPEALEPVALDVQRQVDGGDWATIQAGLEIGATWTDRTPPLAGRVLWRAVTSTADAATAEGPEAAIWFTDGSWQPDSSDGGSVVYVADGYLTGADGLYGRAMLNLAVDESDVGLADQSVVRFAGDTYGLLYEGVALSQAVDATFVAPDREQASADGVPLTTVPQWRDLLRQRGPKIWRDPAGRRLTVSTAPGGFSRFGPGYHEVSLSMERVREE